MPDFFDILFGNGAKPMRRDAQVRLRQDVNGNWIIDPVSGESFTLSPDSSVDRLHVDLDRFYHCGCNAQSPMGGQCAERGCKNVSCAACFGRCGICKSPLCLEHSRFLSEEQGQRVRLCRKCHDTLSRSRAHRSVVKALVSPFIAFDDRRGKS